MNQLTFEINNGAKINTIYAPTTKPDDNHLTLVIASTAETTLTSGQLVEIDRAPDVEGTIFYLALSSLNLSPKELNALTCKADGWSFKVFADSNPPTLCITPTQEITLKANQKITVTIENFTLAQPPAGISAQLSMYFYRAEPISSGQLPYTYNTCVTLLAPPKGRLDLHSVLKVEVDDGKVIQSLSQYPSVQNRLMLTFAPGNDHKVIEAGDKTTFTVGFVYANDLYGYGALTTVKSAFDFSFTAGNHAADWTITSPPAGAQNPGWLLRPPAGEPILVDGVNSTVSFDIDNIVTSFQAGATLMVVSYANVPGYDDGSFSIPLTKEAHVDITDELSISPNPAALKKGSAEITVSWKVSNAAALFLMPGYINVSGKTEYKMKLDASTQVTLLAFGNPQGSIVNFASRSQNIEVLPMVNSFIVKPLQVYVNDFPHPANLYWNIDSNRNSIRNYTTGAQDSVKDAGTLEKSVAGSTMWRLIAQDSDFTRDVLLQAFTIETETKPISQTPGRIAAAPMAQFIALTDTAANSIAILDAVTLTAHSGSPIAVGQQPVDVAFSNDGHYLYVANAGDATLSVIAVTLDSSSNDYQFSRQHKINLSGNPQRIIVSPDDKFIMVTSANGVEAGTLAIIERDQQTFGLPQQMTVGVKPSGMAFTSLGAQLFVANAGDNTVDVLSFNPFKKKYKRLRTINDVGATPVDIGLAGPNQDTLLVVCSGSDAVLVMNNDNMDSSQRRQIAVGKTPISIAVSPDGAYAFIANQADNSVTLISCYNGANGCKVLETAIATGNSPLGIAYASGGRMVFIANTGAQSVSVLNLSNYKSIDSSSAAVGIQPNGIATSPDSRTFVAWHNALTSSLIPRKTLSPGLYLYDIFSKTVTPKLSDTNYIQFAYSPIAIHEKALGIKLSETVIDVIETQDYTVPIQIPYPKTLQPVTLIIPKNGKSIVSVGRDSTGQYSLVVYSADFAINNYKNTHSLSLTVSSRTPPQHVLLASTSDGAKLFVLDAGGQQLMVITRKKGMYQQPAESFKVTGFIGSMALSPDDAKLYMVSRANMQTWFYILDTATMQLINIMLPSSYARIINFTSLCISPDGGNLFLTDAAMAGIRVVDAKSLRIVQTLSLKDMQYPSAITILPDASQIAFVGQNSNNVGFIDQL